jgi:vacuolar-type H+-ATPase subunit E/Vma4
MALDSLLATLEAEGARKAAALVADARADAGAAVAAAQAVRERKLAAALAERRAALDAALQTSLAACRQEAEREVLAARDEVLGRVRERAEVRLGSPGDARAERTIVALARAAATYLGAGGGELRCAARHRDALAPVALEVGLTLVPDETVAGAMLVAADRRVAIDATLPSLLRRRWPDEAILLSPQLEDPA